MDGRSLFHLRLTVVRRVIAVAMLALMVLLVTGWEPGRAEPGRRVALVVGNGDYQKVQRLTNPTNDARLVAQTLARLGFTVIGNAPLLNADKQRFDRAVQEFGRQIQGAEVALFYYSGHGLQVQGVNWLVPVDANPTRTQDMDFQMVSTDLVLRQMQDAGTRLNILVLDACRNNPFGTRGLRGVDGGLAQMLAPEGTLISYATQPGNVAADGSDANSPYTAALARAMQRPGLDIFRVFNQVGLDVKQATAGEQQPWLASSPISGDFYFSGPVSMTFNAPVVVQQAPPRVDADALFWQSIAGSPNAEDYRSYLKSFPDGRFADLARRRITEAAAVPVMAPPVAAPAPAPMPSPATSRMIGTVTAEHTDYGYVVVTLRDGQRVRANQILAAGQSSIMVSRVDGDQVSATVLDGTPRVGAAVMAK